MSVPHQWRPPQRSSLSLNISSIKLSPFAKIQTCSFHSYGRFWWRFHVAKDMLHGLPRICGLERGKTKSTLSLKLPQEFDNSFDYDHFQHKEEGRLIHMAVPCSSPWHCLACCQSIQFHLGAAMAHFQYRWTGSFQGWVQWHPSPSPRERCCRRYGWHV